MTDFVDLIVQNMQEYNAEVVEKVNEIAEEIGKEALKRIKKTSPRDGGKYAKGWRFEVRRNNDGAIRIRIYNKTGWQLTHLLENGHVTRSGGRTRSFPHIRKIEDWANQQLQERLEHEL